MKQKREDLISEISDYNKAIKNDNNHVFTYTTSRGYLNAEIGKKKEAIEDFQKAVRLFRSESMLDEIKTLQTEIRTLENEIKNTPWWQMRIC